MCENAVFHTREQRRTVLLNHVTSRFGARANREPIDKRCRLSRCLSGPVWMICGHESFIFDDEWSRDGDSSEKWYVKAACGRHRRTEWTAFRLCLPIPVVTWHVTVTIHRVCSKMRSGSIWFFFVTVTITVTITNCTVSQKNRHPIVPIISSNLNRFSKFFHCSKVW